MPDHVLTARIYFSDEGNAENAYNHIKALAEHSAAHDRHVGGVTDPSWGRLHTCYVAEDDGDTSRCVTSQMFVLEGSGGDGEPREWAPGQNYVLDELTIYEGVTYRCLQPNHTTQAGWEPPSVPAVWQVVE